MLSVILITKNEQDRLRRCLESLRFADEIIVLDSGSTDATVSIAREYTKNVEVTDWPGFGPQKQRALERATSDWVLSIDADEVVDDTLREEILATIANPRADGYLIPRLSYFCGSPVRHGGWYPDYILRLFRRSKGRFTEDLVHEKIIVNGETAKLRAPLHHYSYENLEQVVDKYNTYSTLGARKIAENKDKKGGLTVALVRAFLAFFKIYVLKLGFLDGRVGFMIAATSAETAYYKYLKLYFLRKR